MINKPMVYLVEVREHFSGDGNGYLTYNLLNTVDIDIVKATVIHKDDIIDVYGKKRKAKSFAFDMDEGFLLLEDKNFGNNMYKMFLVDMNMDDYNMVDDYEYFYHMTFNFLRTSKIDTIINDDSNKV